ATATGPRRVSIHQQKALFFIRASDQLAVQQRLGNDQAVSIKLLELKRFAGDPVCAVYFDSQQKLYRARDQLKQSGIDCYESDIRPPERFLCERFITAAVDMDSDSEERDLHNIRLQPGDYRPQFEVMSFDIESDYQSDDLFSIAFVSNREKRVLMIGNQDNLSEVEFVPDESALIKRWIEWVDDIDPDIFIGWNVVNFDLRLLQKRASALGIPFTIGRDNSVPNWRKSQADASHHFVHIPGRVVLDGIETLRSATYNFASFALDSVAGELLGRGKLIHSEGQTDPLYKAREIKRQFQQEKMKLAAYNLEDCQLVWDVFEKVDLVAFSIERASLTGLEMDRAGGSVAAFDNLYLPRLHRKGYIAPNIGDYQGELTAPGGYVMDSKPGLQDSVLVLDYKSLYPSIIRTFRVDPYARVAAKQALESESIEGFDGARFHKTEHILPQIIENLWAARDQAKREGNAALSQAIKIIMNSFYGVLGTNGCRLHDSRLTSSITKRGQQLIIETVKLIEANGYEVIYGDTDSVFVSLNGVHDNHSAEKIGSQLSELVNQHWKTLLEREHGIESFLEMEFETHFKQFFMPTMRGSDLGSKKRYAGLVEDDAGRREIKFKGLEAIRTDWTEMAREFQQVLYQLVFDGEEYESYILETLSKLHDGKFDHQLKYRKRLHKKLSEYQKNIPPHAQAAIKAEAEFKRLGQPSRYHNKSWIEYVITLAGAQTLECQVDRLDYQHYIDKQLTPIADTILNAVDSSMASITDQQQALF
ncbi:MAG: DNA polymerase II, partial [Pseudomonadota bacterium]